MTENKEITSNEKFHIVGTERVELGRFAIRLDTIEKDGKQYPYSYVEFKECVAVLPFVDGNICLLKQYRHNLKQEVLEIPGGSVDLNELPQNAAIRELQEETGYECKGLHYLGCHFPSPGATTEKCHLYYAECGELKGSKLEPLEVIENVIVSKEKFEKMIMNGTFVHSLGLIAWLLYNLEGKHD